MILSQFQEHDIVPDWPDFINEAIQHGWNLNSLRTKIQSATGDVYGPIHRDEVLKKFDIYVKNKRA